MTSDADQTFMRRAIELAKFGLYSCQPNPRVGCVIVRNGHIIAEGWHEQAGGPHAEAHALLNLKSNEKIHDTTVYVTLEPCSFVGRTPACAEALAQANVSRVVVAMLDPNPRVQGSGMRRLEAAGIATTVGVLEQEAKALNPGYVLRHTQSRPFVRVKLACSIDGRTAMANGESKWITSAESRQDVQRWRARSSAIITGVNTLLHDQPSMNVRFSDSLLPDSWPVSSDRINKVQPLRVLIDSQLRVPQAGPFFSIQTPILVAHTQTHTPTEAPAPHIAQHAFPTNTQGKVDLPALLNYLAQLQCNEVLVESGPTLAAAFAELDLVDEWVIYIAPTFMGHLAKPLLNLPIEHMHQRRNIVIVEHQQIGPDLRVIARP